MARVDTCGRGGGGLGGVGRSIVLMVTPKSQNVSVAPNTQYLHRGLTLRILLYRRACGNRSGVRAPERERQGT